MKNSGYGDYYKTACKQFNSIEDNYKNTEKLRQTKTNYRQRLIQPNE